MVSSPMSELRKKKCLPCEGGVPPMRQDEVEKYLALVPGWRKDGKWISKEYQFQNFMEAIEFVNKIAGVAEEEGHHPDIHIYYNRVRLDIWTHAINGLSENDFILADKIDALV
ncbi:MAG: 4a-hydroxytetrahydrobiopterin dehydratase [bacterium]